MSFFSDLFSKKSIIDSAANAADAAVSGIDMLVFTEEEKSLSAQKLLDWKLEYQKATSPQNLSRRYIAVIVTLMWALLLILMVAMKILGGDTSAKFLFDTLRDIVMQPFSIIIGFYFLSHITGKFGK